MEIKYDTIVRSKWHAGFQRDQTFKNIDGEKKFVKSEEGWKEPDAIIIHGTSGPGTLEFVRLGMRESHKYAQGIGLFHDLIERDGTIWNLIDWDRWVFHSSSYLQDRSTIGIEMLNPARGNTDGYTLNQYKSLMEHIFDFLIVKYPSIHIIASHDRYAKKYSGLPPKPCPGPLFDWDRLESEMKNRGYSFDTNNEESYWNIKRV